MTGSNSRETQPTKNRRCARANSARCGNGRSSIRSRSATISAPRISSRSARRTSWPTPNCSARPASNGSNAGRHCPQRAAPGAHSDDHRSARHRLRARRAAQAAALDARPRTPRYRGLRGARRADDRYLHQLSDHHAAGARRAYGLWRHRRRHLFQQRLRRALEFRGRAVGAERRPHRADAALRLSSRRTTPGDLLVEVSFDAARTQRLGRARRHRRAARRRLLASAGADRRRSRAEFRRDEAFRRGAGELRLGRAVSHGRHYARGDAASTMSSRRRRTLPTHEVGEADIRALQAQLCAKMSKRSMSSCSRRRSSASWKCKAWRRCSTAAAPKFRCSR